MEHWLDTTLEEARTILIEFCKENDIPNGRNLARRIQSFARDPQSRSRAPLTEFELFVAVDALGDHGGDSDDEMEILFQFVRWSWWSVKFKELPPGEGLKSAREVEAEVFHRRKRHIGERLKPSDN